MPGIVRFENTTDQEQFFKRLEKVHTVEIDLGENGKILYPAMHLGNGAFGVTIKIDVENRSLVFKIYTKAGQETNYQIVREAEIHNEMQLRMGLKYISGFSDRELFVVTGEENGILKVRLIPYTKELVEQDVIATLQDFASGVPLTNWYAESTDDLVEVFNDYADSLDTLRAHGVADADRNFNNVFVNDKTVRTPSRITQIDFGTASLVAFDVRTLFRLIRKPGAFESAQSRMIFLADVFSYFIQRGARDADDIPEMEQITSRKLMNISRILLTALTKTSLARTTEEISNYVLNTSEAELGERLDKFDELLDSLLPIELQPYINLLLSTASFSQTVGHQFSDHNPNVNWETAIGRQAPEFIKVMYGMNASNGFGHYLTPCPATILGKVDPHDFEKMSVCANYQMMWALFAKLGLGRDVLPIDFSVSSDTHGGDIGAALYIYEASYIPLISEEDFMFAAQNSQRSVLKNLESETMLQVYRFFANFFESFHATEVVGSASYRNEYRLAKALIEQFENILSVGVTSNLIVEG